MKRRTLVRKLGAAGIGAAALSGSAAAADRPSVGDIAIDRDIDVAAVDGEVPLAELLEPHEVADLSEQDLSRRVSVAADADTITLAACCQYCPESELKDCDIWCECCIEDCTPP